MRPSEAHTAQLYQHYQGNGRHSLPCGLLDLEPGRPHQPTQETRRSPFKSINIITVLNSVSGTLSNTVLRKAQCCKGNWGICHGSSCSRLFLTTDSDKNSNTVLLMFLTFSRGKQRDLFSITALETLQGTSPTQVLQLPVLINSNEFITKTTLM